MGIEKGYVNEIPKENRYPNVQRVFKVSKELKCCYIAHYSSTNWRQVTSSLVKLLRHKRKNFNPFILKGLRHMYMSLHIEDETTYIYFSGCISIKPFDIFVFSYIVMIQSKIVIIT
ncbi:uncharacterized protein LOC132056707 [Lycium ferocissimum]|uniref:uncharacterized protein LOC132056707 n=1 Tax=Lycium ferocissimum TaxID=112874 RepID=UPI002815EE05|nr:uncharacterized protein LOC132056707 [Lycium ferocissimum]